MQVVKIGRWKIVLNRDEKDEKDRKWLYRTLFYRDGLLKFTFRSSKLIDLDWLIDEVFLHGLLQKTERKEKEK